MKINLIMESYFVGEKYKKTLKRIIDVLGSLILLIIFFPFMFLLP
jgi:lipopolysaccharide/colanic/teichoic acid biosynthesis glycosyltransferase